MLLLLIAVILIVSVRDWLVKDGCRMLPSRAIVKVLNCVILMTTASTVSIGERICHEVCNVGVANHLVVTMVVL